MADAEFQELTVNVGGADIHYLKGGSGRALLTLHGIEGNRGWLKYHAELARHFTVYAPTHPGFAGSERPPWLESFIDLARFYLWIIEALGLGKTTLLGHFIGGWMAAEIAVMSPQVVERLVLIDAAGIKPREGEITDIFLHGFEGTRKLSFHDLKQVPDYDLLFGRKSSPEERERQVINRETAIRYCWKPYMHDPALPHLLPRLRGIPALIVWGREDKIVPLECAGLYHKAIAGSRLEVITNCGHYPQFERRDDFIRVVSDFLSK
ncbi:MAG: alpha/beta fold hydrolase [Candidatus Binataceae bacterium]